MVELWNELWDLPMTPEIKILKQNFEIFKWFALVSLQQIFLLLLIIQLDLIFGYWKGFKFMETRKCSFNQNAACLGNIEWKKQHLL